MLPLSCVNCAFNALQTDSVGTAVGYCVEHRSVLTTPSATTCGRLMRKDLMLKSAKVEQHYHQARYARDGVYELETGEATNGGSWSSKPSDLAPLMRDPVGAAVARYGELDTKIESLSQLSVMDGARAEIGLASLGRTYVNRCVENGGQWTSGLHVFWWIASRVAEEPKIELEDLRETRALPLGRQLDLARWSIVMLRLTFLSDVGQHARSGKIRTVRDLPERAAEATGDLSFKKLMSWVRKEGVTLLREALPESRYAKLSRELHRD